MKKIIVLVFCISGFMCQAQKMTARNGKISFFSKTNISNIEAHNRTAISVLDKTAGRVEFAALMKGFEFEKALMQEHFNEDYVESDKYPKASFKGAISNPSTIDFSKNGTYAATVTGTMTLHGVTKPLTTQGKFQVENGEVTALSEFTIMLSDYNIKVPSVVSGEISNNISIKINFKYH
jgi:polyisoprenoid-binding protein YceI